jgi:hypothetical protein
VFTSMSPQRTPHGRPRGFGRTGDPSLWRAAATSIVGKDFLQCPSAGGIVTAKGGGIHGRGPIPANRAWPAPAAGCASGRLLISRAHIRPSEFAFGSKLALDRAR